MASIIFKNLGKYKKTGGPTSSYLSEINHNLLTSELEKILKNIKVK
jgi:hypothetical protein